MKILTREEEEAHSSATWQGGLLGALGGVVLGTAAVYGASRRFPAVRSLSLPFRAFLVTSTTSFTGVIAADRASRQFEKSRHAEWQYEDRSAQAGREWEQQKDLWTRTKEWVSEERYPIVFSSWVASMAGSFWLVSRNRYLSGQQKLVQARVYAQGLTLAVLIASFALESNDLRQGKGRWETVKVRDAEGHLVDKRIHHEAYEGEDQWMDMIEAQEQKMKARGHATSGKKQAKEEQAKEEPVKKSVGVKKQEAEAKENKESKESKENKENKESKDSK